MISDAIKTGHFRRFKKPFLMVGLYKNWLLALCDRFHLLAPQSIVYTLRNGVQLRVQAHTSDVRVINEIWIDQIYSPAPDWRIQNHWLVMDLGAHKGVFSTFAANARRILAVEAHPETYRCYRENIVSNNLQGKVRAFQGLLSNDAGEAELYIAAESAGCSSVSGNSTGKYQRVCVPKIPISRIFYDVERVELVKMDIEGSEFELLLSSGSSAWLKKVRRLAMEYHDHFSGCSYTVRELISRLHDANFQVTVQEEWRMLWAEKAS